MQKNPTSKLMIALTGLFGLAALVFGIVYLMQDTSSFIEVEATVVSSVYATTNDNDIDSYNVTITYPVNGVETTDTINRDQEYAAGEQMTVYYDPKDPGHVFSSRSESTFLGGIGVVFGLYCLGSLGWGWLKSRREKNLPPPAAPTQEPPAV